MFSRKNSQKKEAAKPISQTTEIAKSESRTPTIIDNQPFHKKGKHTKVTIIYDVGFSNQLVIRGNGGNLNWNKGQPLKNTKADEWVWETDSDFDLVHFKVLVNDKHFEIGDDKIIRCGSSIKYTPNFG